jgi:predicted permease
VTRMIERFGEIGRRVRMLMRRSKFDSEMDEEMRLHREMKERELVEAGESPEEAHYAAQRKVGNTLLLREESREAWGWNWLEHFLQDVRFGFRTLRKSPGFTAAAVLTLALGIGANTATFSILNTLLLRELPVPHPERVVRFSSGSFSYPDYVDFRNQISSFEGLCADYELPVMANLNSSRPPERVMGTLVTGNFFSTLGVKLALGRGFLPEDDQLSDPKAVVILSHNLWRRRLGADSDIVGKTLRLNNASYTVVGVTSPEFRSVFPGLEPDFWVPMALLPQLAPIEQSLAHPLTNRNEGGIDILGRIKAGTLRSQTLAEVNVINDRIRKADGIKEKVLVSLDNPASLPGDIGKFAFGVTAVLMLVAGLVLLIACVNVMNLLLARATMQRKEFAIRLAIGASRSRLIRQLVTGNLLLSLPGAALGFLFSVYALAVISRLQLPLPIPLALNFRSDIRVLLLTAALAVVTTLFVGWAPAFQATRPDVAAFLRDGDSSSGSQRGRRLRDGLVVSQVAASVVALVAASLFLHSLKNAYSVDLGFDPKNLLVLRLDPKLQGYSNERGELFFQQLHQQVSGLPGVRASSFVTPLPLAIVSSGRQITAPATRKTVDDVRVHVVGARYFETMGIPLLRGHAFSDETSASALAAVISEAMAKNLFADENPVGQTIQGKGLGAKGSEQRIYEVIGVVSDTKSKTVGEQLSPCLYLLMDQNPDEWATFSFFLGSGVSLLVRTAGDPKRMVDPVLSEVHKLDPEVPVYGVETMEEQIGKALFIPKVAATLLGVFGGLGLTLAAIGLYGVMSYSVSCRRREIAIRMALGASAAGTLRTIAREGVLCVAAGLAVGFGVAALVSRLTSSLLYSVSAADPLTFGTVPLALLSVACIAVFLPARRAMRVDPMVALRYE